MSDRAARVWAGVVAAHDDDTPVSVAALCRAAVLMLGVDGASVTATSGPVGARAGLRAIPISGMVRVKLLKCAQRQFGAGDDRIGRRCHDGRGDTVDLVVSHTEAAYDEQILPLNEAAAAQFVKQCNNPRSLADHRIKETETIGTACILRSHG